MGDCGSPVEFVDGVTVINGKVIESAINDSTINNSTLENTNLSSVASITEQAAKTIVDAIAALSPQQLSSLAFALSNLKPPSTVALDPATTTGSELPTLMYGVRTALLGKPVAFVDYDGVYVVPVYLKQPCP